jgi:hypothetical protein
MPPAPTASDLGHPAADPDSQDEPMPGKHSPSFDARLYRAVLRLCPGEFRREHGDEMACDFDEARSEVASAGAKAFWRLRLQMGLDLARTLVVQWLRTGLPVIACIALACSFVVSAGLASAVRRLTFRLPTDGVDADGVAMVLLAAVVVLVIVVTIVFNQWVHRPRRVVRR